MYENTTMKGFTLLGFSEYPHYQVLLFFAFLIAYLLCILENTFLIVLVCLKYQLHTPMYFLICQLAFLDICMTTLICPKFLLIFFNIRSISFQECMAQFYLYVVFQSLELLLLTAMSYDRYVAICNPLHYNTILNKKFCIYLTAVAWMISSIDPAPFIHLLTKVNFCKSHKINHFFCDPIPLLNLSCGSIDRLVLIILIGGLVFTIPCLSFTFSSYVLIISVILKIQSAKGRRKAFSTCSSHLAVVSMLYGTLIFVYYVPPSSNTSGNSSKTASLLNTVLVPILNPLLYSLRNKDVKNSFLTLIKQKRDHNE